MRITKCLQGEPFLEVTDRTVDESQLGSPARRGRHVSRARNRMPVRGDVGLKRDRAASATPRLRADANGRAQVADRSRPPNLPVGSQVWGVGRVLVTVVAGASFLLFAMSDGGFVVFTVLMAWFAAVTIGPAVTRLVPRMPRGAATLTDIVATAVLGAVFLIAFGGPLVAQIQRPWMPCRPWSLKPSSGPTQLSAMAPTSPARSTRWRAARTARTLRGRGDPVDVGLPRQLPGIDRNAVGACPSVGLDWWSSGRHSDQETEASGTR